MESPTSEPDSGPARYTAANLVTATRRHATVDQLDRLQTALNHVHSGWAASTRDPRVPRRRDRPRDGRSLPYPGVPSPWQNPDPDNVAHYRWTLMFHSFLYSRGLRHADIARAAGQSRSTLRRLLTGEEWGMGDTRLAATWELWRRMLDRYSVADLLVLVGQDGLWLPAGVTEPVWHLVDGSSSPWTAAHGRRR